jgi:hypothetical protein
MIFPRGRCRRPQAVLCAASRTSSDSERIALLASCLVIELGIDHRVCMNITMSYSALWPLIAPSISEVGCKTNCPAQLKKLSNTASGDATRPTRLRMVWKAWRQHRWIGCIGNDIWCTIPFSDSDRLSFHHHHPILTIQNVFKQRNLLQCSRTWLQVRRIVICESRTDERLKAGQRL